ncbi:hypothetical protein BASA61_000349 [Batrachochytrium salamandrivorans]|nr:hypothetical protein BASA62_000266 [Batrachochytrium salamandrivorans]KAH6560399.1 hypothetical protein BASA60_000320 [Batrachochytrium salamandrivorans]KAH6578357.1 hypothetical protein BASA61_000349 [Batrachochytrium salamandrivorans]KAH9249225.1 hypothetical protein BASA81_013074 [Batrachochytrium salamandrivorans]KAH9274842.1 hypothetical protein BASA83_002552 [Batrachochytrium salamandrivorans]
MADAEEWLVNMHNDIGVQWMATQDDATLDAIIKNTPSQSSRPALQQRQCALQQPHTGLTAKSVNSEFVELLTAEEYAHIGTSGLSLDAAVHAEEPIFQLLEMGDEPSAELVGLYTSDHSDIRTFQDLELDYAMQAEADHSSLHSSMPVSKYMMDSRSAHAPSVTSINLPARGEKSNEQILESVFAEQGNFEMMNSLTKAVFSQIDEHFAPVSDDTNGLADMYAFPTPSRPVEGEELMELLLSSARQIKWSHVLSSNKSVLSKARNPKSAVVRQLCAIADRRTAKRGYQLSDREKQVLFSVYQKLNDAGAADQDEFLDKLMHEALAIVDRHTVNRSSKL